jgi:hypothetical protein
MQLTKELYFFDTFGVFIQKNVFPKEQIELANKIFDDHPKNNKDGKFKYLDIFESHRVFLDFFTNETLQKVASMCLGQNFRLDHGFLVEQDCTTASTNHLHGKSFGKDAVHFYLTQGTESIKNNTCWTRTGQLSAGIVLKGQRSESGGFGYIKGSHKSSYFVRGQEIKSCLLSTNELYDEYVTIPDLDSGDLIIFPENLVHGQCRMRNAKNARRMVYGMLFPSYAKFAKWDSSIKKLNKFADTPIHQSLLSDSYIVNLDGNPEDVKPDADVH